MNWHWNGYGFKAMGTRVYIWFYSPHPNSSEILQDIQSTFNSVERRLSRFLPHSELSLLNRSATPEFRASPTLFSVMETAKWATTVTGGMFDPTILDALERAGYDRSFETIAGEHTPVVQPLPHTRRWQSAPIDLDAATRTIIKPHGVKIDLGGIGKGWTVDRAADRLAGNAPFLVNAGGDLYAYGAPPNRSAWAVDIPHPRRAGQTVARLQIANRAVATSSIARRQWRRGNIRLHHLIDPRTGRPADTDVVSATVVARRTVIAEVLAKTAVILGARDGLSFLEAIPDVAGLLITADDRILTTPPMEQYIGAPNDSPQRISKDEKREDLRYF